MATIFDPTIEEIKKLARGAGEIALRYFRHKSMMHVANKFNDSDIVTAADKASDAYIREYISSHYPHHSILSEETGESVGDEGWRWVIDPIDGTTNFYSGIPFWAISIGLELNGVQEMGVVYMPYTDEMFSARRGKGAYLNDRRINVSEETKLSRCVVSTGFPVDKDTNPDNNLDNFAEIMPLVRDIRRLGSSASDTCYVAAGFQNAYWELNLHEWDINAATLIVKEAGGEVVRFRHDRGISILCGNKTICDEILSHLHHNANEK